MSRDYEVKKESGFISVRDYRPVTFETVKQFCSAIPELARESGVFKILVDNRHMPKLPKTLERFTYAFEIAKHCLNLKIAAVQDAPLNDPQGFGETVAVNRGLNIRMFRTLEEACKWLGVKPDKIAEK